MRRFMSGRAAATVIVTAMGGASVAAPEQRDFTELAEFKAPFNTLRNEKRVCTPKDTAIGIPNSATSRSGWSPRTRRPTNGSAGATRCTSVAN